MTASADRVYAALADPTRRHILARLRRAPARVTEVAVPFPMSLNAVSKHVRVLERAGLVRRHVRGRDHYLSLNAQPLRPAWEWLGRYQYFWEARLDALESFLAGKGRGRGGAAR